MNILILLGALLALIFAIARRLLPLSSLVVIAALFLAFYTLAGGFSLFWGLLFWTALLLPATLLGLPAVRLKWLSRPLLQRIRKVLPPMSETERDAIEAGSTWWEAELFRGSPDWGKLQGYEMPALTDEEQAFIDGPVEQLCAMIDDWDITHRRLDLPPEIWDFLRQHGFFGMIIPKRYGGLEFSAYAHSCVVTKISARSNSVGVTVMVPNSLGPAELLLHYGTEQQKNHYLPRLADGREIPCFALTGPEAGSDAGAIPDHGVVCMGEHHGEQVLGLRLNWEKRYITLGPVATVLGLAFKAFDPDGLLGGEEDLGITCALIPADTPGITIGNRHFPLNNAFMNGPNSGKDVFIPMDYIIGGQRNIGNGWRMLVESLSVGRGISLPAVGVAAGKACARHTGAYAYLRKQFNTSIGKFEGVEEALARIGGMAYMMEAGRLLTLSGLDAGEKPSVITAILKCYNTEHMRQVINDSMDVHGGRGICDGPSNYLQSAYQMVPVGITVEGANILTRSLITFTQGALRAHPYLYDEIRAVQDADRKAGLDAFERAFMGHLGFAASNVFAAAFNNLTAGIFARVPDSAAELAPLYRRLNREAVNFALVADMTVGLLGGGLKVKQKLTGRLADALSELYLLSCTLKRFADDGREPEDMALVQLAVDNGLHRFEEALKGAIDNFPITPARIAMRWIVYPYGAHQKPAPDRLTHKVVRQMLVPGAFRDRLTREIFVSKDRNDPTGVLEVAFEKAVAAVEAERKLDRAIRAGTVRRYHGLDWFQEAVEKDVLTKDEAGQLRELEELTARVVAVDHFDPAEVKPVWAGVGHNSRAAE